MNMKKCFGIAAFVFILSPFSVWGEIVTEEWARRYDSGSSDSVSAIVVDASGNVYVTGYQYRWAGWYDGNYITVKYDANGNELWVRRYDNCGRAGAIAMGRYGLCGRSGAIALDSSGNVYVTGDSVTIKYDTNGNVLWAREWYYGYRDPERSKFIGLDSSGNVYVTGSTLLYWEGHDDITTVKYDTNGNEVWVKRYSDMGVYNYVTALAVDSAGNSYVTGYRCDGSGCDFLTIKYDTNGNEVWVKQYDSGFGDKAIAIALDSLSNVYVTGNSKALPMSGGGFSHVKYVTVKYDTNGNENWVKQYDISGDNEGRGEGVSDLVIDSIGNVYVTGRDSRGYQPNGFLTIKYDTNGNELWAARYEGEGGKSVTVDSAGNVYVTGGNNHYTRSSDYVTIKYNTNGNEVWVKTYEGGYDECPVDIAVDALNNVYITGNSTSGGADYLTIKYSQTPSAPAEIISVINEMVTSGAITNSGVANALISSLNNAQAVYCNKSYCCKEYVGGSDK